MLPVQEGKMVLRLFRILFEMLSKLPPPRPEEQQPLEVVLAPRFTTLVDMLLKQMIDAEVSPFAADWAQGMLAGALLEQVLCAMPAQAQHLGLLALSKHLSGAWHMLADGHLDLQG